MPWDSNKEMRKMTNGNNTSTSNDINVADTIQCALKYAEHGFYVFPVMKNDKIPSTAHGMNDATRDPEEIQRIFTFDDNIGLNCIKSGVIVIDIDNSGDKTGNTAFREFVAKYGDTGNHIPDTAGQRSARDGIHLVFKANVDLINACGDSLPKTLCKDVDIKYNGYIVVEPSVFRGGNYGWTRNSPLSNEFVFDRDIAEMPNWLVREIIRIKYPTNSQSKKLYEQEVFEQGNRHNGLVSEAGRLRRVIDDYDTLYAALQQVNLKKCNPPVDAAEIDNIVKSAIGYTPSKPIVAPNVEKNADDSRNFGVYNDNGVLQRPNYAAIGDYLIKKLHCLVYSGQIYVYNQSKQLYCINASDIESEIITICVDQLGWNRTITEPQRQILSYIQNNKEIQCDRYPFNAPGGGISVRNGVIKIVDGQIVFESPSYEHLFTYRLNVVYDPTADGKPIADIIYNIANGDAATIAALYEIPAQGILQIQQMIFKRAYLLVGPPHTGKSTLMDIYKNLFGYENISSIQLQNLNDRWSAHALENKLLNAYDDLSPLKMADTAAFKTFTGAAFQMIEQKFKDSRMGLVNPVHVFSANTPPFVPAHAHDDDGFWVRWGLIECNHVFTKSPNFNNDVISDENLSGFLNDVLKTTIKIIQNNYTLTLSDNSDYVRSRWLYLSDTLHRFLQDHTTVNQDAESHEMLGLSDLYDKYIEYISARQSGKRSSLITQEAFGIKLNQEFGMNLSRITVTYPSGNSERKRVYYGIVWK